MSTFGDISATFPTNQSEPVFAKNAPTKKTNDKNFKRNRIYYEPTPLGSSLDVYSQNTRDVHQTLTEHALSSQIRYYGRGSEAYYVPASITPYNVGSVLRRLFSTEEAIQYCGG